MPGAERGHDPQAPDSSSRPRTGRKAVTLSIDLDIYARLEQVKEEDGFANLREGAYRLVKTGVVELERDRLKWVGN
ncbi:hypothetical protein [Mesorhizobium sp.]|uniref:hypothetical protein n=1 Tax=Mesorhizobium sp. TaxID=1871066 RepID=UPI000FE913F5|nr:hypothetical protein [Mesorhizobium sp.]RWD10416.1 MAG: hypothetical protein EOS74_29330 [Mesorhizobium sp.]RWF66290.1 MAG: hypothetical protein EOS47_06810 [Mesorhizobium sp.]